MSDGDLDLTPYEKFLHQSLEEEKKRLEELNQEYAKAGRFKKMQIKRQLDLLNQNIQLLSIDLKNYQSGLKWLRELSQERDEVAEHLKPVPIEALTAQAPKPSTVGQARPAPAVGTRPTGSAPAVGRAPSVGQPVASQSQSSTQPPGTSAPQQAPRVGTPVVGKPVGSPPVGRPIGTPIGKPLPSQAQQTQTSAKVQQQETKTDQPQQAPPRVAAPMIGKPIGSSTAQAPRIGNPIGAQGKEPKKEEDTEEGQESQQEKEAKGEGDSSSESQSS